MQALGPITNQRLTDDDAAQLEDDEDEDEDEDEDGGEEEDFGDEDDELDEGLFVRGLAPNITDADLQQFFGKYPHNATSKQSD